MYSSIKSIFCRNLLCVEFIQSFFLFLISSVAHFWIQVINFYELRQRVLIKTVLVMDVLESIVFMSADQSKAFLARHNSMLALRTLSSSSRKGGKGKGATNQDAVPASGVQQYVVVSAGELGLLYVHTISLLVL